LLEQAAACGATDDEEGSDPDVELDLSAGTLEKTNDPVRLYLREMGRGSTVDSRRLKWPLPKGFERGQLKNTKGNFALANCSQGTLKDRRRATVRDC